MGTLTGTFTNGNFLSTNSFGDIVDGGLNPSQLTLNPVPPTLHQAAPAAQAASRVAEAASSAAAPAVFGSIRPLA